MNFLSRASATALISSLLLLPELSYGSDSAHGSNNPWETQYTTETESIETEYNDFDDKTRNALLITHRDSAGRRDGIVELSEYEGTKGAMAAGRYDRKMGKSDLQLRGFGGMENVKDDDYFAGSHARFGHKFADGLRGRIKIGHEQTKINSDRDGENEDIKATFGYGELRIDDVLPFGLEVLAGTGNIRGIASSHTIEDMNRHPYGFQLITTKGRCGVGAGLTKTYNDKSTGDEKNSIIRNVAVFRHASYDPQENKYFIPTGFFLYRDNPENDTTLKILGIYSGRGINGSWQLIEPAVNGITQGMFTRTLAHPNQDVGKAARFNDVGKFSRDYEDGTFVILGADFEQGLGGGLKIAEKEIDFHGTLYRQFGLLSNLHAGLAFGETTEPSFNAATFSMENETTEYSRLMLSFNAFDKYLRSRGMRVGIFSNLTFTNGRTDNTCGLYLNGIKVPRF